jgi:predicted KAP-like P-loop ATPase
MDMKTITQNASEFLIDRPITSQSEDKLKRVGFAHAIADRIAAWGSENLVLGIYGEWGTGKSSIKEMIKEHLEKTGDKKPSIVDFQPWQFSGSEQICGEFFDELSSIIGVEGKHTELAENLKRYGKMLDSGAKWARRVAVVTKCFKIPHIPEVASNAGSGLESVSRTAKSAADALALEKQSLGEIKEELSTTFEGLGKRVLVIIDDIDRLSDEEIYLVMRLVKANADFQNVIFLLLMQKDIVAKALSAHTSGDGNAFLDKIVQISFFIPEIPKDIIQKFVLDEMDRIEPSFRSSWENTQNEEAAKWNRDRRELFLEYFSTLRKAKAFLNRMKFQLKYHQAATKHEIDVMDLATIEMLRLFEFSVYSILPQWSGFLTGNLPLKGNQDIYSNEKYARKGFSDKLNELEELNELKAPDKVRDLLSYVFPIVMNENWRAGQQSDRLVNRAANADSFSNYF